jgi:hypothetical protein
MPAGTNMVVMGLLPPSARFSYQPYPTRRQALFQISTVKDTLPAGWQVGDPGPSYNFSAFLGAIPLK